MNGLVRDRREFLAQLVAGGCGACAAAAFHGSLTSGWALAEDAAGGDSLLPVEEGGLAPRVARWWSKLPDQWVECGLCPHRCRVSEGERGTCGVRENRGGAYYTLVHSRACTLHLDPVEKKPFFHVLPGAGALSVAAVGCNFECKCCQNWEISQARPEQIRTGSLPPGELARLAQARGVPLLACTYTEPVVWSEYVHDIAAAGNKVGVRTLMITNGYILKEPLEELTKVLAAVKVDLKSFSGTFYKEHCSGELGPVLDTLRRLKAGKTWTEVVVLVIPTLNDSPAEITRLARFLRDELGPETPLHFTRFHPTYRLQNLPRTPVPLLDRARRVAQDAGLNFVYVGNVPGHPGESTYCPSCQKVLIRRVGMAVLENRLQDGACPHCQRKIPGIWS